MVLVCFLHREGHHDGVAGEGFRGGFTSRSVHMVAGLMSMQAQVLCFSSWGFSISCVVIFTTWQLDSPRVKRSRRKKERGGRKGERQWDYKQKNSQDKPHCSVTYFWKLHTNTSVLSYWSQKSPWETSRNCTRLWVPEVEVMRQRRPSATGSYWPPWWLPSLVLTQIPESYLNQSRYSWCFLDVIP